jgi:5'-nucleotidase (lipoprotein e(P4) family)
MSKPLVPLLASLVLLCGCAATSPRPVPAARPPAQSAAQAAPAAAPPPVGFELLNATLWTQLSAEHDAVTEEIYAVARRQLLHALHDPKLDALPRGERKGSVAGLKPAVILDVDETVFDNSAYEARLIKDHGEYDEYTWSQWCKEMRAPPIAGALAYTRFAAAHGVRVFYLTNRDQSLDAVTLENLERDGFPVAGPDVFLGLGKMLKGCEQFGTDKGCRRELIGRHYRVLQMFGDQVGDFVTVLDATTSGRARALAPYRKWFGERWFMLPNPMYGNWQPALFDNDWEQPVKQRDAAELRALRTQ